MKIQQLRVEILVEVDVLDEEGKYLGSLPQTLVAPDINIAIEWLKKLKARTEAEDLCMKTDSTTSSTIS